MVRPAALIPTLRIATVPRQTRFGPIFAWANEALEAKADTERDQLALWLPVALGLGIAAWFTFAGASGWIAFLFAACALALAALAIAPGTRWGRALAIFCAVAALGCGNAWFEAARVAAPRISHPHGAAFDARVESVERVAARGTIRLLVHPENAPDLPPRVRIGMPATGAPPLVPGARVRLRAWLMPPAPAALPGGYDFARDAWFAGIGGTGRALSVRVLAPAPSSGWSDWIATVRQRLGEHIMGHLGGGEGAIAVALVNGDQSLIPQTDNDAMRRSGLAHLLSVSGLHLTAVVGAVMLLTLKLLALSPRLALRFRLTIVAAGTGALAGIAYTILTGSQVPTVRSCIASLLILGGIALGREALTMRLVATGALVILLLWPDSLAGPSFQLSFAAIAAIVIVHENARVRGFLAKRDEIPPFRIGRGLIGLILTGLAVEAALTPIGLYYFHKAGLYGTLANIAAIPLTTFVTMPCEALALLFDLVGLGAPFWWLTGKSLTLLLAIAHRTADLPGAVAWLPNMPDGAFALMVAGGLWLGLWRTRWRLWGLAPFAIGALWALAAPMPDLLVTGDGRHAAFRTADGRIGLLRPRAGNYVRSILGEDFGGDSPLPAIDSLQGAACNRQACLVTIAKDGRPWRILAIRSKSWFDLDSLNRACAAADIVVSDRRLPWSCRPLWLKADASLLAHTGGLSIRLGARPSVLTVAESVGRHPWSFVPTPRPPIGDRRSRP
jgi:competence protein ComEC